MSLFVMDLPNTNNGNSRNNWYDPSFDSVNNFGFFYPQVNFISLNDDQLDLNSPHSGQPQLTTNFHPPLYSQQHTFPIQDQSALEPSTQRKSKVPRVSRNQKSPSSRISSEGTTPHIEETLSSNMSHVQPEESAEIPKDQCPICNQKLNPATFEEHYKLELSRLSEVHQSAEAKYEPTSPEKIILESPGNRSKREAAVYARKKVQKQLHSHNEKALNPAEILKTVRANRASRSSKNSTNVNTAPSSTPKRSRQPKTPKQTCFICGTELSGDSDEINEHIDRCLASSTGGESSSSTQNRRTSRSKSKSRQQSDDDYEEGVETYTWGGETRIRTCSLLENGYKDIYGESSKKKKSEEDEDLELDVINDEDTKFGVAQYSEADLITQQEEDETKIIRERVTGNSVKESKNSKDFKSEEDAESNYGEASSTSELLVEALKAKIKEQDKRLNNSYRCLICLEQYQVPLVSTNCWHVYCEKCWLSALGAMKLCPQCKMITAPTDLRKIYL